MSDSNLQAHFSYYIEKLSSRNLVYVHILEGDMMYEDSQVDYHALRTKFSGTYIVNNGCGLVYRYRENFSFNDANPSTFYGGNEFGYTDYPFSGCEKNSSNLQADNEELF